MSTDLVGVKTRGSEGTSSYRKIVALAGNFCMTN